MTRANVPAKKGKAPRSEVDSPVTESMEASVTQDQAAHRKRVGDRPRIGDWVITVALLGVFLTAFLTAQDWPVRAALFPIMVAVLGGALAVVKLLGLVVATVRRRPTPSGAAVVPSERTADLPARPLDSSPESVNVRTAAVAAEERRADGQADPDKPVDLQIVDDEQEEDESLEYVFATAGGRAWLASLAWIAAFFTSFFVLGAYITVPLIALLYLRFAGKTSWWAAGVYAAVTGVLIYVVFRNVVFIPLPTGAFPFLQF